MLKKELSGQGLVLKGHRNASQTFLKLAEKLSLVMFHKKEKGVNAHDWQNLLLGSTRPHIQSFSQLLG